jgi:hypothetical protein
MQLVQDSGVHESFSLAYRQAMSSKHIRTAADLVRFKTALRIDCGACGNSRTMGGFEVAGIFGSKALAGFPARLKCSLCGARKARLSILSPPAPRN